MDHFGQQFAKSLDHSLIAAGDNRRIPHCGSDETVKNRPGDRADHRNTSITVEVLLCWPA